MGGNIPCAHRCNAVQGNGPPIIDPQAIRLLSGVILAPARVTVTGKSKVSGASHDSARVREISIRAVDRVCEIIQVVKYTAFLTLGNICLFLLFGFLK